MKIEAQVEISLHHLMHGISSLTTQEKVKFIMTIVRENPGDLSLALLKALNANT